MNIMNYPHINIFHKERKKERNYRHYIFINLCVDKRVQYNMHNTS